MQELECMFLVFQIYYKKWKYTPAVRSNLSSKLIFASCVWYSDRAHFEFIYIEGKAHRS